MVLLVALLVMLLVMLLLALLVASFLLGRVLLVVVAVVMAVLHNLDELAAHHVGAVVVPAALVVGVRAARAARPVLAVTL